MEPVSTKRDKHTIFIQPQPVREAWKTGLIWGSILGMGVMAVAVAGAITTGAAIFPLFVLAEAADGIGTAYSFFANMGLGALAGGVLGGTTMATAAKVGSYIPPIKHWMQKPVSVHHHEADAAIVKSDPVNPKQVDLDKLYTRAGTKRPKTYQERVDAARARNAEEAKKIPHRP